MQRAAIDSSMGFIAIVPWYQQINRLANLLIAIGSLPPWRQKNISWQAEFLRYSGRLLFRIMPPLPSLKSPIGDPQIPRL
jgi:hypothetical protein